MKRKLTARQEEVLNFIKDFTSRTGFPPTVRELADHINIASPRGAFKHLEALQNKGWIKRTPGLSRSIEFTDSLPSPGIQIPIIGTVPAGELDLAVEDREGTLLLDESLADEDTFLLRVKGLSMIGDHIMPGDLALVRQQEAADDGDLVVVLVGEEATLKRLRRGTDKGSPVVLEPSNPEFNPIVLDESSENVRIIGKVKAVIRLMTS
ncbi:MAG: transcriptional repressor LexA [bacterium]